MVVCVPVDRTGSVDARWGRAARVAVATVEDGAVTDWHEFDVAWDSLHDAGSEARHHARVARFLRDHHVDVVVAHHMGAGMSRMLTTMGVRVALGGAGAARAAVVTASADAIRAD